MNVKIIKRVKNDIFPYIFKKKSALFKLKQCSKPAEFEIDI
jgi:hypothetical protein